MLQSFKPAQVEWYLIGIAQVMAGVAGGWLEGGWRVDQEWIESGWRMDQEWLEVTRICVALFRS